MSTRADDDAIADTAKSLGTIDGYAAKSIARECLVPPMQKIGALYYPSDETVVEGKIITELSIYTSPTGNIVCLEQNSAGSPHQSTFALYANDNLDATEEAFSSLQNTIERLVEKGTIQVSEELLQVIVQLKPLKPSQLVDRSNLSKMKAAHLKLQPPANQDAWAVEAALIHSAIAQHDYESVLALVASGADVLSVSRRDDMGNTILHSAVQSGSVEVVSAILSEMSNEDKQTLFGAENNNGLTPLMVSRHADVTIALLENGASPQYPCYKEGSADLLRAAKMGNPALLEALITRDPKQKEFLNEALIVAVRNDKCEAAIALLLAGASPGYEHRESGKTALQFAAETGNVDIAEALVAFPLGSDNASAMSFCFPSASDRPRVQADTGDPDDRVQADSGKDDVVSAMYRNTQKDGKRARNALLESHKIRSIEFPSDVKPTVLLSLDGGGTKGIITCVILQAIHKRMRAHNPSCGKLHEYFDYIAGTSIGGLIGLAMVYKDSNLHDLHHLIFDVADQLLSKNKDKMVKREDSEVVLKRVFDESKALCTTESHSTKQPRVMVTTTLAHQTPLTLHLIRNYESAQPLKQDEPMREWHVWEAALATSAAPAYFEHFKARFTVNGTLEEKKKKCIDGGMMANNPTMVAITEIINQTRAEEHKEATFGMVVSVGTGIIKPTKTKNFKVKYRDPARFITSFRSISAYIHLFDVFTNQCTQSNGQIVSDVEALCYQMGDVPFFRFSPALEELSVVEPSEYDRKQLTKLHTKACRYVQKPDIIIKIDEVAQLLLLHKQHKDGVPS